MSNPKVFEFAKEIGLTPLALMDKIREWQIPVKSHMSELEPEVLEQIKIKLSGGAKGAAEAKPKKATARKAPAKKAPSAPPVAENASGAAATTATAKASSAKAKEAAAAGTGAAKSPVIRRKTKEIEEAEAKAKAAAQAAKEEAEAAQAEATAAAEAAEVTKKAKKKTADEAAAAVASAGAEAPVAPKEAVAATPAAPATPDAPVVARKKEVVMGNSGIASASTPASNVGRKNIIGRMDLSRVAPQGRPQQGGDRGPGGPGRPQQAGGPGANNQAGGFNSGGFNRPGGGPVNRNIRTGFVAQAPDLPPETGHHHHDNKDADKKKYNSKIVATTGPSAKEREEAQQAQFNAVEFRKREMVFQPKKKKGMLDRTAMKTQLTTPKASKRVLKVNGSMKLSDVAMEMGLKAPQLIKVLVAQGVMANMNTSLDFDTIALILPEFGWEAQNVFKTAETMAEETAFGDLDAPPVHRAPVVTVMGHVDHGKTSLLDAIRNADVAKGEAGGITQHIGAYSVTLEDKSLITFLDTPGHEAFTAMRARGANATDIAVIVVAADDGMMPQTQEAIRHAQSAGVPIIIAVNKIDKPGANPDKIKQQLTELQIVPEEWGGNTIFCEVSALKKTGIKELLENIKLVAEVQDLKANPKRSGTGIVIEAKIERGKGPVATILVKDGTVRIGQSIVAGAIKGRVRSLTNDKGERVQEAGPGLPVEVLGLEAAPMAGDKFDIVKDDETAEKVSQTRKDAADKIANAPVAKMSLEDIFAKVKSGDVKELALVLKADVQGSLEAVKSMVGKLSTAEVKTKIIHAAVGGINESDVLLANTAKGIVLGFNVRPDSGAQAKAKQLGVDVRTYSIVYELVDDMKKAMAGLLTPDVVEEVMGRVEVRNIFSVPKIGVIAGCFVTEGKVQRSNMIRLVRDGKIVYEGKIASLKRFKDDAKEVASGYECGISIENFNDIKAGDIMEPFMKKEVARTLGAPLNEANA